MMSSSQSMPAFHSIVKYAEKNHRPNCPCTLSPEDFQKHDAKQIPTPEEFLLLHKISLEICYTSDQWESIARNHFLILAQKYHPDKNPRISHEICHGIMTHLNKTYNDMIQKIRFEVLNNDEAVVDGKLYTKINCCTVTCRHLGSFSIYGFPDDVNQWRTKLKQKWGSTPTPIKSRGKKIGQQFGNEADSIYINVFDNGTIHIQGIMAIQYSEEIIIPLITGTEFRPRDEPVDRKRFSDLLKKAMSYFKKENTTENNQSKQIKKPGALTQTPAENVKPKSNNPTTESARTKNQPDKQVHKSPKDTASPNNAVIDQSSQSHNQPGMSSSISISAEVLVQLTERLKRAESRIGDLETTKEREESQLIDALKRIGNLEAEIITLKKENTQLKEQTGPKISEITKKMDEIMFNNHPNNTDGDSSGRQNHFVEQQSFANLARRLNKGGTEGLTPTNPPPNQTRKSGRIEFDRQKCFVIDNIKQKEHIKSDDEIRRIVGNQHKVVIDRISRSKDGKIFVQLSDTKDVERVTKDWNPENFGGSSATKSERPQRKLGVLKGVPLDMSIEDIKTELNNLNYADTDVKRITRRGVQTRAVRVKFKDSNDLDKAIGENVILQNLIIRAEELILQPRVTQCYNCYKYNHIAEKCESSKTCPRCASPYDESHDSCEREPVCLNCKGSHASTDKQCPIFTKLLDKQKLRVQNFYSNHHDG